MALTIGQLQRWLSGGVQSAAEMVRLGRLSVSDEERAGYTVVDQIPQCKLRRYGTGADSSPLVLVPPLMLTAEIYDVAPDTSAASSLVGAGIDTWVVDFGAPEQTEGGMDRTLDDHVRGVVWAVRRVAELTGRECHLGGYSQGGMFAYQAAAYLDSEHIASVLTFGSPVDIHRNVPAVASGVVANMVRGMEPLVRAPLERIEGLPGYLSSMGFRMLTPRKELEQLVSFLRNLRDRSALERQRRRRRFLAGEGFVAWPGPALLRFFEDFIVHNRLVSGGFVIDGRSLTLADVTCPVLCFVGRRDDFARPAAVRAIADVAPDADVQEILLPAGHFGLVVGSRAMRDTWPAVAEWVRHRDGTGPVPRLLRGPVTSPPDPEVDVAGVGDEVELLGDEVLTTLREVWGRLGDAFRETTDTAHTLRHQLPRIWRLEAMTEGTQISPSLALAEQARARPEATFFLWQGRAFSYRDADERVTNVARGLLHQGLRPGDRVAVRMGPRPSLLSLVTALGRIGAVVVLASPDLDGEAWRQVLDTEPIRAVITDPEGAAEARRTFDGEVMVLGGGGPERALDVDGVVDLEAVDLRLARWPGDVEADAGQARDLAFVMVRPGAPGRPRIARVTNGRWAFSALGAASTTALIPEDTVYCPLPIHHPTGIMVAVGAALVSGARLAISPGFSVDTFWRDVRRYGATVVFYAGDMARPLVLAPSVPGERRHSLRTFAGSGMRRDVWWKLQERFGVGVVEFYASTERNLILSNAAGRKRGAIGRLLPGSVEIALARYDFGAEELERRGERLVRADAGQWGVALARAPSHAEGPDLVVGAFEPDDRWWRTGDVLRRDAEGDYGFVDRLSHILRTPAGPRPSTEVEQALLEGVPRLAQAAVFCRDGQVVAAVVGRDVTLEALDEAMSELSAASRPEVILWAEELPITDGYRPLKSALRDGAPLMLRGTFERGPEGYRRR